MLRTGAIKHQMRPIALGRKNWLFAGSLRAGQRSAAVMRLIQSAKLNGHDPHAYRKDVMEKLPTWRNSRIEALLPHRWQQGAQIRGLSLLGVGFHRRVTTVRKPKETFRNTFRSTRRNTQLFMDGA
jgi:hypothetical protein